MYKGVKRSLMRTFALRLRVAFQRDHVCDIVMVAVRQRKGKDQRTPS